MKKIVVLPPDISTKIAAGEVIERPFSVVKELVENSLDAHASEIQVEIISGGRNLVRVTDNGHGMSREDALVCFERHSTSKISRVEDLSQIKTLGFRGEALPSISAVSRIVLKTSDGSEDKGILVEREGEDLVRVSDLAFPKGTCVEVKDLFFNLPVRKKFLRSERSELNLIVKFLTSVSLAFSGIKFSLHHGKRQIFNYPRVGSLRERIFQIFGKSFLDRLLEVENEENGKRLYGYASRPPFARSDRSLQLFFVNNRSVKDRTLQAALNQAYRGFLEKDRFAEAFLFLSYPYADVDVNVHPAKAEVRFRDTQPIFSLVLRSIEKAILTEKGVKEIYPSRPGLKKIPETVGESRAPVYRIMEGREREWKSLFPSGKGEDEASPRVLGQYLNTYIVALSDEAILIVDQHNAHERVLFEQYQDIDKEKRWPQKISLMPLLFDLSPSQVLSLETHKSLLEEAGFRVEAMGGRSFALKEFPDIFEEKEAKDIFLSLLEEVKEEKIENKKTKLLATLACKTAVKAGEPLAHEKMCYLVEELFKTSNSSLCPHGRPIVVEIKKREIEKGLKRSGN